MSLIDEFLKRNSKRCLTCHILGDCMVDEYYAVKVTRISPESPAVKVMVSKHDGPVKRLPGGAANVAHQLLHFNVDPILYSWVDEEAWSVFNDGQIHSESILLESSYRLPRKRRFFDGDTQVSDRWDIEKKWLGMDEQTLKEHQYRLYKLWRKAKKPDVVILSDYNKGFFHDAEPLAACWRDYDVPVIVDPKKAPIAKWKGCDVFKPNAKEAEELSGGLTNWKEQCDFFRQHLECKAVIITQAGDGLVGKAEDYFEYRPPRKLISNKNEGAGDCFIAVLALAIGHRFSYSEAAEIAFTAGTMYVQNENRQPITPWQLQRRSKFVSPEELRHRDYKLVFTNGCYDILHSGHLETLRTAKSRGDKLVVAVNSDASVSRLKGPSRPVVALEERMELLSELESVDFVVSFDEDSPLTLIEQIRPDVLVKGEDWKAKGGAVGSELVKEVYFVPLVSDKSTTSLIEKIKTLT